MDKYWIWLSSVPEITPEVFDRLIETFGSAQEVWNAKEPALSRLLSARIRKNLLEVRTREWANQLFRELARHDILCITRLDERYPALLKDIYDPPATLFVRGNPDLDFARALAVVGTRRPTHDGARAARELSAAIAAQGVTIVSGLAMGIDALAQRGALDAGGRVVAVLPGGPDNILPRENSALAQDILDSGGSLISERPPGARIYASSYPARNRIISGLCPAALIVEAGHKSGAMITANLALEQSREVFAVPGSIYSEASKGTNALIADGATPVLDEWCVLEPMGWATKPGAKAQAEVPIALGEEELCVVQPLRNEILNTEELVEITKISWERLNYLLTTLELRGIIVKVAGGGYRAIR